MSGPAGPDWGEPGGVAVDDYRLEDAALDDTVVDWPRRPPRPWESSLDIARGTLIREPGQAHHLAWVFDDVARASEIAAAFAEVDPSELVADADGYFEAVPVRGEDRRWRIVARYVADGEALFPDFQTWAVEWLIPTIHRPLKSGVMWCPEWWRHSEAVARLDALWRAWESARTEGGAGMAYWWDMHFDSHFAVLTSDRGPFAACKDRIHAAADKQLPMLPCDPPPENWIWPSDLENGS